MKNGGFLSNLLFLVILAIFSLFATANTSSAIDSMDWDLVNDRVSADLSNTSMERVLEMIATRTGWAVFREPGQSSVVSVKFKNLPRQKALKRVLGSLNFALISNKAQLGKKLVVFYSSAGNATEEITPRPRPIEDELLVTLNPDSKMSIGELARKYGAKIIGEIKDLNSYRLSFEDADAAKKAKETLESDPNVADLDQNYLIDQPVPSDLLGLGAAPPLNLKASVGDSGGHTIVGLIDTAVQIEGSRYKEFYLDPISLAGEALIDPEFPSHGTSMAETVLKGVTMATQEESGSSVRILPVDVYGPNEETNTFDIARGIYSAMEQGATVINMSLGGAGSSPMVENLIRQGSELGVIFIGAAGNEPTQLPNYPAAQPEVLAVTAGDRNGNLAAYANRGEFVDIVAPGTSLIYFGNRSWIVSGTSPATALVSGMAAGIAASSGKTVKQVETELRSSFPVAP